MARRARIGSAAWQGSVALPEQLNPSAWVEVDAQALSEERRALYLRRRRGIELYFAGATEPELKQACGLGRAHIYRLITERCLQQHPDGNLYGWRGALPHARVKAYTRAKPVTVNDWGGGAVGALQYLLGSSQCRGLQEKFHERILARTAALQSPRRSRAELFRWFIEELRQRSFEQRGGWPFNVAKLGYTSICRYIDRVLQQHPRRQRQLLGGRDAERKARAGDGIRRPLLRLLQRVECDAHKLDARMVVMVPSPHGGLEPRRVHRLWVVVLIEVTSRVVLGYHLSLRRECSAEDVLRAIKCALSPWQPRELQFSGNAYASGAGLPSYRSARYLGACWEEFSVDGALANICARVEQPLRDVVGARVLKPQDAASFSCRRSLDDRPYIESFFRQLAAGGFHKLAATTGSSPSDRPGDPVAAADATQFQLEYAEALLDVLIANYNATPHSGLGWRTPLDQLDYLSRREGVVLRTADPGAVRRMVGVRKLCTVLGGVHTGRRPYFNFANARYSAEWLCLRTDLVGQQLWLHIEDEDDARWASVSTPQGLFLGQVRAAPPWHLTPHTLYMRQAIRALDKRRLLHLSSRCDAVEELMRYAESSPGRKLPAHPAYLEARRVLSANARELGAEAEPALAPTEATQPAAPTTVAASVALPPMRKAQQW